MKRLIAASIGVLFSCAALGQDLLQCVNPDVVKGVLFSGRPEAQMSITATLPEAMAGFTAPSGFALVGTSTRAEGSNSTVAFRTNADSETAFAAMLGAFEAAGWVSEEEPGPAATIFVLDSEPVSGTICRDSERRSLNVQDINGRRYVSIALGNQSNSLACNAEDPRLARAMGMMSVLTQEAPTLRLPDGTTAADGSNRISNSAGSSGETYRTGDQIRIAQSAESFINDLSAQMRDQGWTVETSWSGTLSKGGRWTRTGENGFPYWATIELVDVGNGIQDLSFRLMMPPN